MHQRKPATILSLLIILILSVSCTKDLSSDEIKQRLIEANSNVKSYKADIRIIIAMRADVLGQKLNAMIDSDLSGSVDQVRKRAMLKGLTKSQAAGMRTEIDNEVYIIDNYVYTKSYDNWVKQRLESEDWEQNAKVQEVLDLVQSGTIEVLEEQTKGSDYYVVKINPDVRTIVELALRQQQGKGKLSDKINFNDIIKEMSMTVWVNKKDFIIEKSISEVKMVMTNENLGVEDAGNQGKVEMDMKAEYSISDVNKPVNIVLPPEANGAMELDEMKKNLPENFNDAKDKSSATGASVVDIFG